VFYRTYCVPYWEAIQIKVKNPKPEKTEHSVQVDELNFNTYMIKEVDSDTSPVVSDEPNLDSFPELNIAD